MTVAKTVAVVATTSPSKTTGSYRDSVRLRTRADRFPLPEPAAEPIVVTATAPVTTSSVVAVVTKTTTTPTSTLTKTKSFMAALSGGSQEQIVEKAKQEAYVMQRISELQKEGLWTERRLPKVQETGRCKSHWDYLLEEMVWLAADFAQERKWKKAAAKKVRIDGGAGRARFRSS